MILIINSGKSTKFSTSQRLADEGEKILKKIWFTNLEIIGICRPVIDEEYAQKVLQHTNTNWNAKYWK